MAHKFVAPPDRRQNIIEIQLARLVTADRTVPVVATVEHDRITLFWWSLEQSSWIEWSRFHQPVQHAAGRMADIRNHDWSLNIGLTASNQHVYLVYQRKPLAQDGSSIGSLTGPHVYMDILEWDFANALLKTPEELGSPPFKLPFKEFGQDVGPYIWAGWHWGANRLVILTQLLKKEISFHYVPGNLDGHFFEAAWNIGYPNIETLPTQPEPPFPPLRFDAEDRLFSGFAPELDNPEWLKQGKLPDFNQLQNSDQPIWVPPAPGDFGGRVITEETTLPHLFLLASKETPTNPTTLDEWESKFIEEGGYDFDARIVGGKLHCIHRHAPYALHFRDISEEYSSERLLYIPYIGGAGYPFWKPLSYCSLDLYNLEIKEKIENIPGGDHPQIQLIAPLSITVDRVTKGEFIIPAGDGSVKSINTKLEFSDKTLLVQDNIDPNNWIEKTVFRFKPEILGRDSVNSASTGAIDLRTEVGEASVHQAGYSSLVRRRQIYFDKELDDLGKKSLTEGFLFTILFRQSYGDLIEGLGPHEHLGRVQFESSPVSTRARAVAWQIFDISHRQIFHKHGAGPASAAEEEAARVADPSFISEFLPKSYDNVQFIPFFRIYPVANTIGGNLCLDRSTEPFQYFAYTDLGDGGCRAIFSSDGITHPDLRPIEKGTALSVEDVTGPGITGDVIIELTGSGWTESLLPHYAILMNVKNLTTSYGSAIHPLIDSLVSFGRSATDGDSSDDDFPVQPANPNEVILNEKVIEILQALAADESGTRETVPVTSGSLIARFTYPSRTIYNNVGQVRRLEFDGSISLDSDYAVTSWTWTLKGPATWVTHASDGSLLERDERRYEGFEIALPEEQMTSKVLRGLEIGLTGIFEVSLKVSNIRGYSRYSNSTIRTAGSLPTPPLKVWANFLGIALDTVQIQWDDDSTEVDEFRIYRRDPGSGFILVGTTSSFLFNDSVTPDVVYEYAVAAVLSGEEGPKSIHTRVSTSTFRVSSTFETAQHRDREVYLTWPGVVPPLGWNVTKYKVLRRRLHESIWSEVAEVSPGFGLTLTHLESMHGEDIGKPMMYTIAALAIDPGGVERELTWAEPELVQLSKETAPQNASSEVTDEGVLITWNPPSAAASIISGYRVFRAEQGSTDFVQITNIADSAIVATSFLDSTVLDGRTYIYAVVAENNRPDTASVSAHFEITEIWEPLWQIHRGLLSHGAEPRNASVQFGKYFIEFQPSGPSVIFAYDDHGRLAGRRIWENRQIHIKTLDTWQTEYRFKRQELDYGFRIEFDSKDVVLGAFGTEVLGWWVPVNLAPWMGINRINTQLRYYRSYTPGVFMSDQRAVNIQTGLELSTTEENLIDEIPSSMDEDSDEFISVYLASALAAKPNGPTKLEVMEADIDISFTALGHTVLGIVELGLILGIERLVTYALTLYGMSLNPITATIAAMLIFVFLHVTAKNMIENYIEGSMRTNLEHEDAKYQFDDSPLMWNAGEGLAEALARKALLLSEPDIELPLDGSNRYRNQFWQTIVVDPEKCRVIIRKE